MTKCELCEFEGAFSLDVGDTKFYLCPNQLVRLVTHSLTPEEAKKLIERHGNKTFYLHDDFYDEDGHALQPTITGYEDSVEIGEKESRNVRKLKCDYCGKSLDKVKWICIVRGSRDLNFCSHTCHDKYFEELAKRSRLDKG